MIFVNFFLKSSLFASMTTRLLSMLLAVLFAVFARLLATLLRLLALVRLASLLALVIATGLAATAHIGDSSVTSCIRICLECDSLFGGFGSGIDVGGGRIGSGILGGVEGIVDSFDNFGVFHSSILIVQI